MAAGYTTTTIIADEQFVERQRLFEDFLSSDRVFGGRDYKERIRIMLKAHERRLVVNLNDLRQTNVEMANGLLKTPLEWLPPLELALKEVAGGLNDPAYDYDLNKVQLHVGFEGSFGSLHTTPRYLSSALLSHMVCLDGIITSCSLVRPKLVRSVHYSATRKAFLMREYWDSTMLSNNGVVTPMNYPTSITDPSAGVEQLISEFGLGSYRDYQTVCMQEMPEKAPAGQLPRTVDVILDDDLVDVVKPGDRAQIVGVYKTLTGSSSGGAIPSFFRTVLIALRVRLLSADSQAPSISDDDMHNIKAVSRRRDLFDLMARSLAPSIYGHYWVKKAIFLMLLGGVEKNLASGTHLRGDINLMLVGDPSTAKSQLLRFVLSIAPLAIATTGRGSSGVGLTAAVTTDRETGERRLEAGAMVLADRGIVCIDEFDKMSDVDRVAIHEVMEQQTVTIAKAGIHASLNARCSVLAAANPIWGQYRETASPQENIRLPDSLLSRFDLLFIILDVSNPDIDRRISNHVLKMHRYIPPGLAEGQPINDNTNYHLLDSDEEEDAAGFGGVSASSAATATAVFQKHYALNMERARTQDGTVEEEEDEDDSEILTLPFFKKYIHYARTRVAPVLTKSATDQIVAAYAEFRQKREAEATNGVNEAKTFPVTPRTLDTLIRLATAHAKARLSAKVERKDAKVAIELVQYCLYKEIKKKPSKRRKQQKNLDTSDDSDALDNESDHDEDEEKGKERMVSEPLAEEKARAESPVAMEGLSLEEVSLSLQDHSAPSAAFQSPTQTQPTIQSESPSLRGDFVDPSQPTSMTIQASMPTARAVPSAECTRRVRAALHRLRSASSSAVFSATMSQVHDALIQDDAEAAKDIQEDHILAVLEEMQRLNQVMLSEGTIYII